MRSGFLWSFGVLVICLLGFAALSLSRGQERPAILPPLATVKDIEKPTPGPARDLGKLPPLQRQMELAAQRGAEWLCRANRPDGRFVHGYVPALQTALEGDHYLRQVGAAVALARATRHTHIDRHIAVARQAILTLLLDTALDGQDARVRHVILPSAIVNRLAAAGLLVQAINELPSPGDDLLEQSEELCLYISRQQRADGSLNFSDVPGAAPPVVLDPEGINYYPGEALYGLMISQRARPAAWKTAIARKALAYYYPWWKTHQNMAFVPWQTAAYAEAYRMTKEQEFADCVYDMTDWMSSWQYNRLDAAHPLWFGGFMSWADGKPVVSEPGAVSASYADGIAAACRVARQAGDLPRYRRYRESLERCLQFLCTLQYTDANTQHFAAWYRPTLVGGFHASHQDGNIRVDYNQNAVCALIGYLTDVTN